MAIKVAGGEVSSDDEAAVRSYPVADLLATDYHLRRFASRRSPKRP